MITSLKVTLQNWLGAGPSGTVAFVLLAAAATLAFGLGISAIVLGAANPLRRRLGNLGQAETPSAGGGLGSLLEPFSAYLLPKKEADRSRTSRLLVQAGYRSPGALPVYFASKAFLMVALPLTVFFGSVFFPTVRTGVLTFIAIGSAFLGALIPSVWLDHRVKVRHRELRVAFPDALDLLVVCVEAGLGLAPALQRVADDLAISHPALGTELSLVNAEMRAGVERTQALKNLADRTGLADIRGLVALLVQTMRFGTGVADALRVYSEEFRDKRMQAAEEAAAKIGTKMIFPLVTCLFPSFFLVAIGPAVLRLVEVFRTLHH